MRFRRCRPNRRLPRRSRGLVLGGLWLRWRTHRRAQELDTYLAAGADPFQTDELSLRVGQLATVRTRARLATSLRGAVSLADMQYDPFGLSRPLIQRAAIRASRRLLLELGRCLSEGGPLGVEGLAMASLLVNDMAGPLYRDAAGNSLAATASATLGALERGFLTVTEPS
jgi:hypothetical protein